MFEEMEIKKEIEKDDIVLLTVKQEELDAQLCTIAGELTHEMQASLMTIASDGLKEILRNLHPDFEVPLGVECMQFFMESLDDVKDKKKLTIIALHLQEVMKSIMMEVVGSQNPQTQNLVVPHDMLQLYNSTANNLKEFMNSFWNQNALTPQYIGFTVTGPPSEIRRLIFKLITLMDGLVRRRVLDTVQCPASIFTLPALQ